MTYIIKLFVEKGIILVPNKDTINKEVKDNMSYQKLSCCEKIH